MPTAPSSRQQSHAEVRKATAPHLWSTEAALGKECGQISVGSIFGLCFQRCLQATTVSLILIVCGLGNNKYAHFLQNGLQCQAVSD